MISAKCVMCDHTVQYCDDDENLNNHAGPHNKRQMYLSLSVHCSNKQKHMANYYAE